MRLFTLTINLHIFFNAKHYRENTPFKNVIKILTNVHINEKESESKSAI